MKRGAAALVLLLSAAFASAQEPPAPPKEEPAATETPPPPRTLPFLDWLRRRPATLGALCPSARARKIHFSQSGDDETGDGTDGRPFKTVAKAAALLAASEGNLALLFRRDHEWNEERLLVLDRPNVTIGAWGDAPGRAARFSMFRLKYKEGWKQFAGHRFTRKEPEEVAWLRLDRGADAPDPRRALRRVAGATACENTPDSFFYDRQSRILSVHLAKEDPNAVLLEACPRNTTNGFDVRADGCRLEELRVDGFGLDPDDPHAPHAYGIRWSLVAGQTGMAHRCETYYGGTTLHGTYAETGPGGRVVMRACRAGFAARGPSGEAVFSSLAGAGGQETWFVRCTAIAGTLPDADGPKRRGDAFRAGTGGTPRIGLVVATESSAIDGPIGVLRGARFEGLPPAAAPEEARGFVVGEVLEGAFQPWIGYRDTCFVNCGWNLSGLPDLGAPGAVAAAGTKDQRFDGFVWNALVRLDFSTQTGNARRALLNPADNPADAGARAWFLHSRIVVHASQALRFCVDYRADDPNGIGKLTWKNSQVLVLPPGATAPPFEFHDADASVGVEYDFEGRPRDAAHPSVGPLEKR